MAKRFVPGAVGVHDAAGNYKQAYDFYQWLLRSEKETQDVVAKAEDQIAAAKEAENEDALAKATDIHGRALEMVTTIQTMRVRTIGILVLVMKQILGSIENVMAMTEDPVPELVHDIAEFRQRLRDVYEPFFGLQSGNEIEMPNVEKWGDFMWNVFHRTQEGPILLWQTLKECQEKWGGENPCEGADYLKAWSLANQVQVQSEAHIQLLKSVQDDVHEFFTSVGEFIAGGVEVLIKDIIVPTVKGAARGLMPVAPFLLAGGLLFWLSQKRKKT